MKLRRSVSFVWISRLTLTISFSSMHTSYIPGILFCVSRHQTVVQALILDHAIPPLSSLKDLNSVKGILHILLSVHIYGLIGSS